MEKTKSQKEKNISSLKAIGIEKTEYTATAVHQGDATIRLLK